MAFKSLQDFVKHLDKINQLKRIELEIDPFLEMAEITDRVSKKVGPALFFENPRGKKFPVLTNAFGSPERVSLALGRKSIEELAEDLTYFLELKNPGNFLEKLSFLPRIIRMANIFPKMVSKAPCQEVTFIGKEASLDELPVLTTWPADGGPFITLPVVITKNPHTGTRNLGMYRMQIYDQQTTGMHWHKHKGGAFHYSLAEKAGKRLPVAVAIGPEPAVTYAATAPLPDEVDEILLAGFLNGRPVEMTRCLTQDLEVPAQSQFVLEGYVEPFERRLEGPFGDHTGYYSLAEEYPVFHLTALTRRKNPIYPATLVGPPPMEDSWLGKATERFFLPVIKKQLPEVVDINLPLEGVFHNFLFLSINKRYPGQARKVMYAVWGLGQMMFTKIIVVLDADVDVQNVSEVLWRLGNNVDPRRDVVIVDGPLDALDHSSPMPLYGGKMGFDATRKGPDEGHHRPWPDVLRMSEEVKKRIDKICPELKI